jgi:hypothetical protein
MVDHADLEPTAEHQLSGFTITWVETTTPDESDDRVRNWQASVIARRPWDPALTITHVLAVTEDQVPSDYPPFTWRAWLTDAQILPGSDETNPYRHGEASNFASARKAAEAALVSFRFKGNPA